MRMRSAVVHTVVLGCAALAFLFSGLSAPAALASGGGGGGGGGGGSGPIVSLFLDTPAPSPSSSGTDLVELTAAAGSNGATVTVRSSNTTALQVPSSVLIPSGSTLANLAYTTGAVTTATTVTLTATLGTSTASASVTVTPLSLGTVLAIPGEVEGGTNDTVRPQLTGPAPAGGAQVSLTSSNPALAPLPASVTIPAGSSSTPITVSTGVVTAKTTVTFTATWNGSTATGQVVIDPIDTPISLVLSPSTTDGPNGSSGVITVANPAPSNGVAVDVTSSNPAVASVESPALVGNASTKAGFNITTTEVTSATDVTITATAGGVSVQATLTVIPTPPPAPALQAVTVNPGSVAGGSSATGTATLNVPAPAGGAVVTLATSNATAARVPASVTVPAGSTSATFTVTTTTQSLATTVSVGGDYGQASRAALLGISSTGGGLVLAGPPAGVSVDPPWLDHEPEGKPNINPQFSVFGSLEGFTLTVESGSLPPGMTLISPFRPNDSVIQGTPGAQGTFAFVFKFTGSSGTVFAVPYVWVIDPPAPLQVPFIGLPAGTVGQAYEGDFAFTGGVGPFNWSISAGALPKGLKINSTTGQVTGTPQAAGTFSFTARLTDSTKVFLDTPTSITISS